ncbi:MAG: hypothetical protein GF331_03215 [Chitinivibrionales bacterium]|nr:hypothetical protein [Chitinivibrionales bacterium]
MKRFAALLRHDMVFQFRHGFYYAYLVATLAYIGIIYVLPPVAREKATLLVIFTDTSLLGMFFVGALVLLERDQNTLAPLFVTPVSLLEYLVSKAVSLTAIALLSSLTIYVAIQGPDMGVGLVAVAVTGASLFFTLIGLSIAARSRSVPDYFIRSLGWGLLLCLPMVDYFGVVRSPLFYVLPPQPVLVLLDQSFGVERPAAVLASVVLCAGWVPVGMYLARRGFRRHLLHYEGAHR